MAKVLVLDYSVYGNCETMAQAAADGARSMGAAVDIKRVPEIVPEPLARQSGYKLDQVAPADDLESYGAIILGTGTRYGRLSSQMAAFLDKTGGLLARGALNGKEGGAITSTGSQHGCQETTLSSLITNLMHFGIIIVGMPATFAGMMSMDEIVGGAPYGATTITGGDGKRQPSAIDLSGALALGKTVARTAAKQFA